MTKHIFEHKGVLLECFYSVQTDGQPLFSSVRVLGADYKPTGPDLCPLLHDLVVMVNEEEGTAFLSTIVSELA